MVVLSVNRISASMCASIRRAHHSCFHHRAGGALRNAPISGTHRSHLGQFCGPGKAKLTNSRVNQPGGMVRAWAGFKFMFLMLRGEDHAA